MNEIFQRIHLKRKIVVNISNTAKFLFEENKKKKCPQNRNRDIASNIENQSEIIFTLKTNKNLYRDV